MTTYYDTERLPYNFSSSKYRFLAIGEDNWDYFLSNFGFDHDPYVYSVAKDAGCRSGMLGDLHYFKTTYTGKIYYLPVPQEEITVE